MALCQNTGLAASAQARGGKDFVVLNSKDCCVLLSITLELLAGNHVH